LRDGLPALWHTEFQPAISHSIIIVAAYLPGHLEHCAHGTACSAYSRRHAHSNLQSMWQMLVDSRSYIETIHAGVAPPIELQCWNQVVSEWA
jgi:hypothetical protein